MSIEVARQEKNTPFQAAVNKCVFQLEGFTHAYVSLHRQVFLGSSCELYAWQECFLWLNANKCRCFYVIIWLEKFQFDHKNCSPYQIDVNAQVFRPAVIRSDKTNDPLRESSQSKYGLLHWGMVLTQPSQLVQGAGFKQNTKMIEISAWQQFLGFRERVIMRQ